MANKKSKSAKRVFWFPKYGVWAVNEKEAKKKTKNKKAKKVIKIINK